MSYFIKINFSNSCMIKNDSFDYIEGTGVWSVMFVCDEEELRIIYLKYQRMLLSSE